MNVNNHEIESEIVLKMKIIFYYGKFQRFLHDSRTLHN